MKTAAVVAEFNPFHKGHKFLFEKIKKDLDVEKLIVIMSGDFVQRGQPSIISKQHRTTMALNEGADLVLLLPVAYSTASAGLFAFGAVSLLDKLNCVDYLCFSSECASIDKLTQACNLIYSDNDFSQSNIKKRLSQGLTFAQARSLEYPQFKDVLCKPNNILGIEYINAIKKINSSIQPITFQRSGNDYNDILIKENKFASASAIRNIYTKDTYDFSDISLQLPQFCADILISEFGKSAPIDLNMFSSEIFMALYDNKEDLSSFLEISGTLSNKINHGLLKFEKASSFIDNLKSRDLTYSRISRALLHVLLNIKGNNDTYEGYLSDYNHIRILGMKKESDLLLKEISQKSQAKLFSSVPKVWEDLNDTEKLIYSQDLRAATIYDHVVLKEYSQPQLHEYSKKLIVI